jgi:hypothetical protein
LAPTRQLNRRSTHKPSNAIRAVRIRFTRVSLALHFDISVLVALVLRSTFRVRKALVRFSVLSEIAEPLVGGYDNMASQQVCESCGAPMNPGATFCASCGATSAQHQDKPASLSDKMQQRGGAVTGAVTGKLRVFGRGKQQPTTVDAGPMVSETQIKQPAPIEQRPQPNYYQGSKVAEKVEGMLPGEIPYVVAKQSRVRPGGSMLSPAAIVATDRRVLFRNPKLFGLKENLKEVTYDQIGSVTAGKGLFGSKITLQTAYFGALNIDGLSRDDVHKLVDVVHWHVDAVKDKAQAQQTVVVQTAAVQQEVSAVDKLKKLAELRDMGIISPAEFEEKKNKLMEQI